MPDLLVAVATDYLMCSEADLLGDWQFQGSLNIETLFGIRDDLHYDSYPASAYRGPFVPLLRYHPKLGLELIIAIFNHSAEWYANPRVSESSATI